MCLLLLALESHPTFRLVVAANRATAYNPSGLPVTLSVDGTLVTVPPGTTVSLARA